MRKERNLRSPAERVNRITLPILTKFNKYENRFNP